ESADRLACSPPFPDHARQRARDRLWRAMHEDVAADRTADRSRRHRGFHTPKQLVIFEARSTGEDDRDTVGRFDQAPERCLIARPVGLDDVGAELAAQTHIAAQILESVALLQL